MIKLSSDNLGQNAKTNSIIHNKTLRPNLIGKGFSTGIFVFYWRRY